MKIGIVFIVLLLSISLFSGCINLPGNKEYKRTFSIDIFSFDNKIIFVMNEPFVEIEGYFDVSIDHHDLNNSCYDVYYQTNEEYAGHTFVVVNCKHDGSNFTNGEDVKVIAYYSHPDYDFDFYTCQICCSCMRINEGWYPYECEFK